VTPDRIPGSAVPDRIDCLPLSILPHHGAMISGQMVIAP